jgi:hypothetical protein
LRFVRCYPFKTEDPLRLCSGRRQGCLKKEMVSLCFAKGKELSRSVRTSQSVVVDDEQCENRKGILALLHSLVVFRIGKVSLLGSKVFANLAHSQNNVNWYSKGAYVHTVYVEYGRRCTMTEQNRPSMKHNNNAHQTTSSFRCCHSPHNRVANNVKATAVTNLPETSTKARVDGAVKWKGFQCE